MRLNAFSATSVLLLWVSFYTCAAAPTADPPPPPPPTQTPGVKIPLRVRSPIGGLTPDELGQLAQRRRNAAIAKYSRRSNERRSTGYNLIGDLGYDSLYYGSLAIGTPLTSFDIILDTGSADLWVMSNSCGSSCDGIATFDASSSSTFKNVTTPFSITYGSGEAAGYLAQDVVEMAGFSVTNQGFAVVDQVSSGLLEAPVSGLLGLAWQAASSSGDMPFWQTLASNGAMDSALFAIQLRRYSNATKPSELEPGGEITLGYTNSSLYTGSIEYIDIPGTPSYWYLDISSLTVQGTSVSLGSDTSAAIDTGTTNVGGPSSAIAAIYAQIPNSSPAGDQYAGYYQYPCSTSVTVEISFGGQNWTISPADFQFTQISSSECIGSFYELTSTGEGTPSWILGDTFLKNVYSVFRYNPPAVGFAALSEVALAENGVNGAAPSATIGSVAATVTNTSGAAPRTQLGLSRGLASCIIGILVSTMTLWVL